MATSPNKLSQFWQELKRRNVIRVTTVYAGAAFVIIELINNITEPLRLPEWTPTLVIVLLAIGFPVVIIFSWIYDVHPEVGIVKTEPVDKVKEKEQLRSSNSWKIASYFSFVVIVGLIILNIIPRTSRKEVLDKSIVVLPFDNLSSDQENKYFIEGMMESILDNLCKIEDLRVPGRTSVEQYRDNLKPIPIVAEEMDVAYVLEGSGQKIGNRLLLTVQLIIGHDDRHIWSKQYDREITRVEDLIDIQKEIAQLVVEEIEAIITPEEKELIEKVPTNSLPAYDFYQRANELYWEYWWFDRDAMMLDKVEELYFSALYYDSTYADVYAGLANVYWAKYFYREYLSESFLDSAMTLVNIAISYDDRCSEAYRIRGACYRETGYIEQAVLDYDKALEYNPNDWMVYVNTGNMYSHSDIVKSLESWQRAMLINRGSELPILLRRTSSIYSDAGFYKRADYLRNEALKIDGDSSAYFASMAEMEFRRGDYTNAFKLFLKSQLGNSTDVDILFRLGITSSFLGQQEKSLEYFEQWLEQKSVIDNPFKDYLLRIGYANYCNGNYDKADSYFNQQIKYNSMELSLDRSFINELHAYYNLAGTYAFLGDREKAFEYLGNIVGSKIVLNSFVSLLKNDPLFENIRDEPAFQQIVRDVEANFQEEHDRVMRWLEKNEIM